MSESATETSPEQQTNVSSAVGDDTKSPPSFLFQNQPYLQDLLLKPLLNSRARIDEVKIRRLYLQAASQQWYAPSKVNYESPHGFDEESRRVWAKFHMIFYTLEQMGLNVISNMMVKAVRKLHSEELGYYLAAQCYDESRHVFAIKSYLKKLGEEPRYQKRLHVLGQVASMGLYRVENWLFSTLFSENFASCFLRRARQAKIDTTGNELCKYLLIDESRHIHFLHIVLPDLLDRMSLLGRSYVQLSQFFIMKFTERVSRTLEDDAVIVGLDRRALLEDVFENIERSYATLGIRGNFVPFPKLTKTPA